MQQGPTAVELDHLERTVCAGYCCRPPQVIIRCIANQHTPLPRSALYLVYCISANSMNLKFAIGLTTAYFRKKHSWFLRSILLIFGGFYMRKTQIMDLVSWICTGQLGIVISLVFDCSVLDYVVWNIKCIYLCWLDHKLLFLCLFFELICFENGSRT